MSNRDQLKSVAIVGAGIAGAACAASLQRSGTKVVLFDKSRGVGGRMATRRAHWEDLRGVQRVSDIDHGTPHFSAMRPRFRALMTRAAAAGHASAWRPYTHATWPAPAPRHGFVAVPDMPALCRHILAEVPMQLGLSVQRLHRRDNGWQLSLSDGSTTGPFDAVLLAMPAPQAALLLAGHQDEWADALAAVRMAACWTLMAITSDVDWPWDAAVPDSGVLQWVERNDRKPGRNLVQGHATWVAHAAADWSAAHLEDDPAAVAETRGAALGELMPYLQPVSWQHRSVHRWRYAMPADSALDSGECSWDAGLGLGVCGDHFGTPTVEGAWRSGDELADTVAACFDVEMEAADAAAVADASVQAAFAGASRGHADVLATQTVG